MTVSRRLTLTVLGVSLAGLVSACSSASTGAESTSAASVAASTPASAAASPAGSGAASPSAAATGVSLKGVCPDTVVVQTNWWPEAEHGFTYALLGPNPTIDVEGNKVTGPLLDTGVNLEIRAGGPAIGYQQVSSLLAQDDSITLGYVGTDEAIQNSTTAPTTAVFSDLEKNPQVWLWGDPSWDFKTTADIGKAGVPVLAFDGSTYLDYFVEKGLLTKDQLDTSYTGSPDKFVVADGKVVEQGFATSEPYRLEHDVKEWGKPVKFILVDEYPVYQSALSVRSDRLAELTPCLKALVPLFQQGLKDYAENPQPVNDLILKVDSTLQTNGFTVSQGLLDDAHKKLLDLGLVANGADGTLGSFEDSRVQTLIDELGPVFAAKGKEIKAGLAPADLATNQFVDPSISLGS